MIKQIMVCDICGEEIATYKKEIYPGMVKEFYKTKNPKYFPHFSDNLHVHCCEKCATLIDNKVLEYKISILEST